MIFGSVGGRWFGCAFTCAALLSSACAGKAEKDNGQQSPASGGLGAGGATTASDGGSAAKDSLASGGSAPGRCDQVVCESIPSTCKHLTQAVNECCPTCTDTGCDVCPGLDCALGTHPQITPGDCCPTCVVDPPDACLQGQTNYTDFRAQLFDKYSSSPCMNSADCTLVLEDNACAYACNIALPTISAHNFAPNLSTMDPGCATCEPPTRTDCEPQIAACVNGKCVTADVN